MSDRLPYAEMAHEMEKMAFGKETWLANFSNGRNKRPDHEIETKRRELNVLQQAAADYERAAERAVK